MLAGAVHRAQLRRSPLFARPSSFDRLGEGARIPTHFEAGQKFGIGAGGPGRSQTVAAVPVAGAEGFPLLQQNFARGLLTAAAAVDGLAEAIATLGRGAAARQEVNFWYACCAAAIFAAPKRRIAMRHLIGASACRREATRGAPSQVSPNDTEDVPIWEGLRSRTLPAVRLSPINAQGHLKFRTTWNMG
jgi:hypothetical protein